MTGEERILAFETGGTKLVAGIAGAERRIGAVEVLSRAPADKARRSFDRIVAAAEALLSREKIQRSRLHAVGFGFGGTVHRSANSPHICLHEEGWEEVDVSRELSARFDAPAYVENDCKLAALAEAHFGAGESAESLFYVTLGTGVGGGYVREGRILACSDLGEAEIGHLVVDPNGPPCCCGNRGCVEAMCSGPGLASLCQLLGERYPQEWRASSLASGQTPDRADSRRIIASWEAGDPFATRVVERSADALATALGAAVNLLVPERVVIGGGLGTATPGLLDLVRERTRRYVVPYFRDRYAIVPSALREHAVTQGAAILASQRAGSDS